MSFLSSSALIPSTSARSLPLEMLSFLASCFSFTFFLDLDLVLEEAVRRMFSTPAVSLHHWPRHNNLQSLTSPYLSARCLYLGISKPTQKTHKNINFSRAKISGKQETYSSPCWCWTRRVSPSWISAKNMSQGCYTKLWMQMTRAAVNKRRSCGGSTCQESRSLWCSQCQCQCSQWRVFCLGRAGCLGCWRGGNVFACLLS